MTNELNTLQSVATDRLKDDPLLSQVEIVSEDRSDLVSTIEMALAKVGVCLVVGTVSAGVTNPNLPGPTFDSIRLTVSVTENVIINRSPGSAQLDAISLALAVARRLHHWRPSGTAFAGFTVLAAKNTIEYQQSDDLLAYDVNFTLGNL